MKKSTLLTVFAGLVLSVATAFANKAHKLVTLTTAYFNPGSGCTTAFTNAHSTFITTINTGKGQASLNSHLLFGNATCTQIAYNK